MTAMVVEIPSTTIIYRALWIVCTSIVGIGVCGAFAAVPIYGELITVAE